MVVGCMKNMLMLNNILFIILNMCAIECAEKLTLIHFCLELHGLIMADPTLKILTVAKEKSLPWKHTCMA